MSRTVWPVCRKPRRLGHRHLFEVFIDIGFLKSRIQDMVTEVEVESVVIADCSLVGVNRRSFISLGPFWCAIWYEKTEIDCRALQENCGRAFSGAGPYRQGMTSKDRAATDTFHSRIHRPRGPRIWQPQSRSRSCRARSKEMFRNYARSYAFGNGTLGSLMNREQGLAQRCRHRTNVLSSVCERAQ